MIASVPFRVEAIPSTLECFVIPEEGRFLFGEVGREERPKEHGFHEDDRFGDTKYGSDLVDRAFGDESRLDVKSHWVQVRPGAILDAMNIRAAVDEDVIVQVVKRHSGVVDQTLKFELDELGLEIVVDAERAFGVSGEVPGIPTKVGKVHRMNEVGGAKPVRDEFEGVPVVFIFNNRVGLDVIAHEESLGLLFTCKGAVMITNSMISTRSEEHSIGSDGGEHKSLTDEEVVVMRFEKRRDTTMHWIVANELEISSSERELGQQREQIFHCGRGGRGGEFVFLRFEKSGQKG